MAEVGAWWIPLASAIAGGTFALAGGIVTQWIASSRERKQQRGKFQMQTLLDLQADLLQIYRGASRNEAYTNEWRHSMILIVRVQDETVRNVTEQFKAAAARRDEAAMEQLFGQVNARIGDIVRSL